MSYSICKIDPEVGYSLLDGPIRVEGEVYESRLHYFAIHHRYPVDCELVDIMLVELEAAGGKVESRS